MDSSDSLIYFMISIVDNFINKVSDGYTSSWYGFYGLGVLTMSIFFAYSGVQYMIGKLDGAALREKLYKLGGFLIIYVAGFILIPQVQNLGMYITNLVNKQVIYRSADDYFQEMYFEGAGAPIKNILVESGVQKEAQKQFQILSDGEAKSLQELYENSGASMKSDSVTQKPRFDVNSKKERPKEPSLWSLGIFSFIGYLLELVGVILATIILFMKGVLLLLYRASFPIVVCLSLLPGRKKILRDWWDGFYTLIMLNVTIILIESIINVAGYTMTTTIEKNPESMNALIEGLIYPLLCFVAGTLYLASPALTTMLFGGNSVTSQAMTSAVQTASMVAIATATIFKKGGSTEQKSNPNETEPPTSSHGGGNAGETGGGTLNLPLGGGNAGGAGQLTR